MAKPLILVVSDAHTDGGPDSTYALAQARDLAIRLGVQLVISAGDSIHRQRNRSAAIAPWKDLAAQLADHDIAMSFIEGQHERDDPPWLSGLGNSGPLDGRTLSLGGVTLTGISYLPRGPLQEALDRAGALKPDVLIAHEIWQDWMGEITVPQGAFADVSGTQLLVTGDLHQYKFQLAVGRGGEPFRVCSPGATWQLAISEPARHSVITIDKDLTVHAHPLRSRPMIAWPLLSIPEDIDRFIQVIEPALETAARQAADLPEALRAPRLRIPYSHRLAADWARIERAVDGRAILYPSELPPEEKTRAAAAARKGGSAPATPLSKLNDVLDPREDPKAHALLARLLQSNNPEAEFAAWRGEFLGEEAECDKSTSTPRTSGVGGAAR